MIKKHSYTPPDGCVSEETRRFVERMCYSLEQDYGDDSVIEEAIQEAVDNGVPIYYADIYGSCIDIAGYVEEAVEEGLYCFPTHDPYSSRKTEPFQLNTLIQAGWYVFLDQAANYNINDIVANQLINVANQDPRISEGGPAVEAKVEEIIDSLTTNSIIDGNETFGYYRTEYLRRLYEEGISTIDPDEGKEDEE